MEVIRSGKFESTLQSVLLSTWEHSEQRNGNRSLQVRALLDSGAQRSYITLTAAAKLGLRPVGEETLSHTLFGGVCTGEKTVKSYIVRSMSTKGVSINPNVLESDKICENLPTLKPGLWLTTLKKNKILISDLEPATTDEIDVLIGADYYGQLISWSNFTSEVRTYGARD